MESPVSLGLTFWCLVGVAVAFAATSQILLLWMLSSLLRRIETLETSLLKWSTPANLAKPLPVPGTTFALSDREQAIRERQHLVASQRRSESMGAGSVDLRSLIQACRPGSRNSTAKSPKG